MLGLVAPDDHGEERRLLLRPTRHGHPGHGPSDPQAWVAELSARGFNPATVLKAYQLLGRTMTAAVNADSVRAGHTSVAFTLDRYGHLFPGHDDELRDRLDAMHAQGLRTVPGGSAVELPAAPARPVGAPARPTAKQATRKARRHTGPELG
jgi:hypothetical protein